jgi:hypothetical protein
LFASEGERPTQRQHSRRLSEAASHPWLHKGLSPDTQKALEQSASPQEWNTLFLASPEFMHR